METKEEIYIERELPLPKKETTIELRQRRRELGFHCQKSKKKNEQNKNDYVVITQLFIQIRS